MEKTEIRFTLKKNERLSSKKDISKLIEKGKQIKNFPFFIRFLIVQNSDSPAKILISVPKKKFKRAYERNRIKRLIRETYRLNKNPFYECLKKNNIKILISITFFDSKMPDFNLIEKKIISTFSKICENIENNAIS